MPDTPFSDISSEQLYTPEYNPDNNYQFNTLFNAVENLKLQRYNLFQNNTSKTKAFEYDDRTPSLMDYSTPEYFSPKQEQYDRYASSDTFNDVGFVPGKNNEELYGQLQTTGDIMNSAFSQMWDLTKYQFKDQLKGWGRLFDFNPLGDDMEEVNAHMDEVMNNNPIFMTEANKNSTFNWAKFGNMVGQTGFTFGAAGEILFEELAMTALTTLTAGAFAPLQSARTAQVMGRVASIFSKRAGLALRELNKINDVVLDVNVTRNIFARMGAKAAEFTPFTNTAKFLSQGTKAGESTFQIVGRGFGNFYRDFREANAAMTEARAEASGTEAELKDQLYNDYIDKYGKNPSQVDIDKFSKKAKDGANANFIANTIVIGISNRIEFDNLFRGFKGVSKFVGEAGEVLEDGSGYFKKSFNLKTAKNILKTAPLTYIKNNLTEGLQESFQSISNEAVKKWYTANYFNPESKSVMQSVREGVKSQISQEGLDTFLSGFAMGALAGPVQGGAMWAINRSSTNKQQREQRKKNIDNRVALLNDYFTFNDKRNLPVQIKIGNAMVEAIKKGDKKGFYDLKDESLRSFVRAGVETNKIDSLFDQLESSVKNLSEDEFKDAYGVDSDKKDIMSSISEMRNKAEDIKNIKEKLDFKYPTNYSNEMFPVHKAYEEAKWQVTFMQHSINRIRERQTSLIDGIKLNPELKNVPYSAIHSLIDETSLDKEIYSLGEELKVLKVVGENKEFKEKSKRYAILNKISELGAVTPKIFKMYMEALDENKVFSREALSEMYESINDYMELKDNETGLVQNLNYIADPKNMQLIIDQHIEYMKDQSSKLQAEEEVKKNPDITEKLPEESKGSTATLISEEAEKNKQDKAKEEKDKFENHLNRLENILQEVDNHGFISSSNQRIIDNSPKFEDENYNNTIKLKIDEIKAVLDLKKEPEEKGPKSKNSDLLSLSKSNRQRAVDEIKQGTNPVNKQQRLETLYYKIDKKGNQLKNPFTITATLRSSTLEEAKAELMDKIEREYKEQLEQLGIPHESSDQVNTMEEVAEPSPIEPEPDQVVKLTSQLDFTEKDIAQEVEQKQQIQEAPLENIEVVTAAKEEVPDNNDIINLRNKGESIEIQGVETLSGRKQGFLDNWTNPLNQEIYSFSFVKITKDNVNDIFEPENAAFFKNDTVVIVVTDKKGNILKFDDNLNLSDKGKTIWYSLRDSKSLIERISTTPHIIDNSSVNITTGSVHRNMSGFKNGAFKRVIDIVKAIGEFRFFVNKGIATKNNKPTRDELYDPVTKKVNGGLYIKSEKAEFLVYPAPIQDLKINGEKIDIQALISHISENLATISEEDKLGLDEFIRTLFYEPSEFFLLVEKENSFELVTHPDAFSRQGQRFISFNADLLDNKEIDIPHLREGKIVFEKHKYSDFVLENSFTNVVPTKQDGEEVIKRLNRKIKVNISYTPTEVKPDIAATEDKKVDIERRRQEDLNPITKEIEELEKEIEELEKDFKDSKQFQKLSSEEQDKYVANEQTIRDLAARMSARIGIPYTFISDRTKEYKGYNEDKAVINLAYATLDTPIHEILGHPIVRAIKNRKNNFKTGESAMFHGYGDPYKVTINKFYEDTLDVDITDEQGNKQKVDIMELSDSQYSQLYQNLVKELEEGRGKEILDKVKRDYVKELRENQQSDYNFNDAFFKISKIGDRVATLVEADGKEYKTIKTGENSVSIETKNGIKNVNRYTEKTYTLEEQQEEAIVTLLGELTADKLDKVKDKNLISLLKQLLREMTAYLRSLFNSKEIEIDKLRADMTLDQLSSLLAYSNSKIILPGSKVEYTTPDGTKHNTYQEASNHISKLFNESRTKEELEQERQRELEKIATYLTNSLYNTDVTIVDTKELKEKYKKLKDSSDRQSSIEFYNKVLNNINLFENSKTSNDILEKIRDNTNIPHFKELANLLIKNGTSVKVNFVNKDRKEFKSEGSYSAYKHEIQIPLYTLGEATNTFSEVFLHEYIHSITIRAINNNSTFEGNIEKLLKRFKEDADRGSIWMEQYGGINSEYYLKNTHEFVVGALLDSGIIKLMNKIPATNEVKWKNLFEEFLFKILELLNITPKTTNLYDEMFNLVSNIIITNKNDFSKYKAKETLEEKTARLQKINEINAKYDKLIAESKDVDLSGIGINRGLTKISDIPVNEFVNNVGVTFKKINGKWYTSYTNYKEEISGDIVLVEYNFKENKEVAKKYPRSLITSKVVAVNSDNERQYSKLSKEDLKAKIKNLEKRLQELKGQISKINAKYDAELAALVEVKPSVEDSKNKIIPLQEIDKNKLPKEMSTTKAIIEDSEKDKAIDQMRSKDIKEIGTDIKDKTKEDIKKDIKFDC